MFNISVLLNVQANLPENSPFLSTQMALVRTFFQMFLVLGMYNFDARIIWYLTWGRRNGWNNHWCSKPCSPGCEAWACETFEGKNIE